MSHRGAGVAVMAAVIAALTSGCLPEEEVITCRRWPIRPADTLCVWQLDAGLRDHLLVEHYMRKDAKPKLSSDFGCRVEVDAGLLVLIDEGTICSRPGYDDTDMTWVSRRCVPPAGTWTVATYSGTHVVTVDDAGVHCFP